MQFTSTDFKLRYKNSILGLLWVILKPLVMFFITYTVWSALFHNNDSSFKMSLLLGLILINFFSDGVLVGLASLMSKAGIILKINFPREVVVISSTLTSVINFLVNMVVFFIFAIFNPISTSILGVVLFIVCVIAIYVIILGLSLFLSVLYVRLRDLHQLVELGLQAITWITPIFYKLSMLPENIQFYIKLNPLTYIIVEARKGLLEGSVIGLNDFKSILVILAIAIVFAFLGYVFFKRNVIKIAEYF
jgi:ABC-type polysaccharide/polyol phosphate export permease